MSGRAKVAMSEYSRGKYIVVQKQNYFFFPSSVSGHKLTRGTGAGLGADQQSFRASVLVWRSCDALLMQCQESGDERSLRRQKRAQVLAQGREKPRLESSGLHLHTLQK